MNYENYVETAIGGDIHRVIELGPSETGFWRLALKQAVDTFNERRGLVAGSGWRGWDCDDPENPKKSCDCARSSGAGSTSCWTPYSYNEVTRHDLEFELDYDAYEVNLEACG